jgi:hypothetical protein
MTCSLDHHLEELVNRLEELAAWREVNAKLEALWTSAAWVRDLVRDWANGLSSLATSLSVIAE